MAQYSEANEIYEMADQWRQLCLVEGKSLLWKDEAIWSEHNLKEFKTYFTDNPDESTRGFEEKFQEQLAAAAMDVTKLACELVLVYFLFPASTSVSGQRKQELISKIALWRGIQMSGDAEKLLKRLNVGIGGTGQYYNTNRPFELSYLGNVALRIAKMQADERKELVKDDLQLRAILIEEAGDATIISKDTLLHLFFPEKYEWIASRSHKRRIVDTFREFLGDEGPEDTDDALLIIRKRLTELRVADELDFYRSPLRECWYVTGDGEELSPIDGLGIKRQVILYGPPGTGKTFEARQLADRIIRQALLRSWKPRRYFEFSHEVDKCVAARTRRVQFHPGYSYEDFVRGLRLSAGGETTYSDGVLLRIVEEINNAGPDYKEVPFVLILDELNRADLSKVLGECFSLLEDREEPVQLAGTDKEPRNVRLPANLLIIGTMNLIDQSLEQIDFALRRRFLWFFRGFESEQFLEVCKWRWQKLKDAKRVKREWDRYVGEFETMAERAAMVNAAIAKYPALGKQYEIGHTYFCDVVAFVEKDLQVSQRQSVLFTKKGEGRDTVRSLWKYSLQPLLQQYLSGIDSEEREAFIGQLNSLLMKGK